MPELTIKRVPLDSLHVDPANARSHGDENMDAIAGSLRRFGQAEPLVVQAGSGRIIGGNGRIAAMRQLGWSECDVVEIDVDDLQATSLGIALNRTAELAEWDEETLARLLEELRTEDALDGIGFDSDDVDELLAELDADAEVDLDDEGPGEPPETPVSRAGDLWTLGEHVLLCGDSTKSDDVARVLDGARPVLLSSDPPYCVRYTGADRPNGSGKDWSGKYNEVDIEDLGEFLRSVFRAVLPRLDAHAALYIWHAHLQYPTIAAVFEEFGLLLHQPVVWVKPPEASRHRECRRGAAVDRRPCASRDGLDPDAATPSARTRRRPNPRASRRPAHSAALRRLDGHGRARGG